MTGKKEKISSNSQRLIGFTVSGLQIVVSVLSGLLFTPFLISSLGQVEYGLYQLLYSAIGYVAVLDLGLGGTITRYIIKYDSDETRESQKSVVSMCLWLYMGLSGIAFIAVIIVSFFLKDLFVSTITDHNIVKAEMLFIIMGISSCLSLFDHAFSGILTAYEKYTITKGIRVLRDIARIFILTVLFLFGADSLAVVTVDLMLMVLITTIDAITSQRTMSFKFFSGKFDLPMLKSLLSFSLFAFLQVIVSQINTSLDRLLLGRFSTLIIVGLYGVAMQLYNMFMSFGNLFGGLTLPMITRVVCIGHTDEEITNHCVRYSRIQCFIMLPILAGFALFGEQFISFWMRDKYDSFQLWAIILIIVTPNILEWIETPIFNVMKAKNMQATRSLLLIFVALCNVVLTVFLVQWNEIYGAAIGTAISFIIGNNILSNIYYHKKVGINMFRFLGGISHRILPAWILSLIAGLAVRMIPGTSLMIFIAKCVLYVLVYMIFMYLIGANASEKAMCHEFAKKIMGNLLKHGI